MKGTSVFFLRRRTVKQIEKIYENKQKHRSHVLSLMLTNQIIVYAGALKIWKNKNKNNPQFAPEFFIPTLNGKSFRSVDMNIDCDGS